MGGRSPARRRRPRRARRRAGDRALSRSRGRRRSERAAAWADPALVAAGAAVGAPPDPLSRAGQNWGLAPVNPLALRRQGYAPFIAALRANMRHAGLLRIDHVMALKQLYWIPRGVAGADGAYVSYPFEDLLRLVALESGRNRCAVVGEDLGTVPDGFRETMHARHVLLLSRARLRARAPPVLSAAGRLSAARRRTFATHDIATLAGFWLGRDLAWRARSGFTRTPRRMRPRPPRAAATVASCSTRWSREGLLTPDALRRSCRTRARPASRPNWPRPSSPIWRGPRARLGLVQIEDVLGESEQANLPGTIDEHPNWRRRLSRAARGHSPATTRRVACHVAAARRKRLANERARR